MSLVVLSKVRQITVSVQRYVLIYFTLLFLLQDSYAIRSFTRGVAAQRSGAFSWEIVPVRILFFVILSSNIFSCIILLIFGVAIIHVG